MPRVLNTPKLLPGLGRLSQDIEFDSTGEIDKHARKQDKVELDRQWIRSTIQPGTLHFHCFSHPHNLMITN